MHYRYFSHTKGIFVKYWKKWADCPWAGELSESAQEHSLCGEILVLPPPAGHAGGFYKSSALTHWLYLGGQGQNSEMWSWDDWKFATQPGPQGMAARGPMFLQLSISVYWEQSSGTSGVRQESGIPMPLLETLCLVYGKWLTLHF